MPSIPLHLPTANTTRTSTPSSTITNPLPPFLRTPSGLAILELQGQLQIEQLQHPDPDSDPDSSHLTHSAHLHIPPTYEIQHLPLGILAFPPSAFTSSPKLTSEGGKRGKNGVVKDLGGEVLLFVGKWQKLRGEVRELGKPLGVLARRGKGGRGVGEERDGERESGEMEGEEVEIVDVVRWKVVFSSRPEPVG